MAEDIKWLSSFDSCDICGNAIKGAVDYFVDGQIKNHTYWALMCPKCFEKVGVGIGCGVGQKYDGATGNLVDSGNETEEKS